MINTELTQYLTIVSRWANPEFLRNTTRRIPDPSRNDSSRILNKAEVLQGGGDEGVMNEKEGEVLEPRISPEGASK